MSKVRFEQLLQIYRHTAFDPTGDEGTLSIPSPEVIAFLESVDTNETVARETGLALLAEPSSLAVGRSVRLRLGAPRLGLGLLVRSIDDLLNAPEARLAEPKAYFIIDARLERETSPPADVQEGYRKVLALVALFAEAASYLDRTRQELVFFRDGKFVVPIRYESSVVTKLDTNAADQLLHHFQDPVHREQKLAILTEAIAHICEAQPTPRRFSYMLENIAAVSEEVRNGYRLFASSFSYAKIRSEVEAAKLEFVGKIHKTFIDIQGQLLGIPVATIIVASQLKVAQSCGLELWTNIAVLGGAWIFVVLLMLAIVNQWLTLSALAAEIERQRAKLVADYAAISETFAPIFGGLSSRIRWHRWGLVGIGLIAVAGAGFATLAYSKLTTAQPTKCWSQLAIKPTLNGLSGGSGAVPRLVVTTH